MAARLATINLGLSQGTAVLGLMERAQIPPLPPFYKLLYDYVAAAPGLFTSRVRDILDEPQLAGDRLYAEFRRAVRDGRGRRTRRGPHGEPDQDAGSAGH